MKYSISSRELRSVLDAVRKVILKRNTLPVLDNALISVRDERFFVTGSSVENTLTMPIELHPMDKEPFVPFCIDVTNLTAILATLPEQPIELTVNPDTFLTTLKYKGGEFNIPAYDGKEYPLPKPITQVAVAFSAPTNILLPAMRSALNVTSEDELRPQMSAVALDVSAEGLTFVGTNGKMLYKYEWSHGMPFLTEGKPSIVLFPRNVINAMDAPFSKVEEIAVRSDGRQVEVTAGEVSFSIRSVEGRYPNYNSVIPKTNPYHVTLPVKELMNTIRRISMVASDISKMIALRRSDLFLQLTADDIDFSRSAHEELSMDDCTLPEGFAIGLNYPCLLTLLSAISTEKVRIELSAPERPLILKEDANNSTFLELLMPMALNT